MSNGKQQFLYTLEAVVPEKAGNPEKWTECDHETYRLHLAHLEKEGRGAGSFSSAVRRTASGRPSPLSSAGTNEEEAQQLMEADPFVARGFARARLHPFRIAFSRNEV